MDKIIPLRVDEAIVDRIDRLVIKGTFRNRNDGIRAGIREILRNNEDRKTEKRIAIARIIANYIFTDHQGIIDAIFLFGSVARGNDEPESDTDILIITRDALSYDQELAIISDAGGLLKGIDEYVSLQFEPSHDFVAGVQQDFEFESSILRRGILLAGTMKSCIGYEGEA